MQGVQELLGIDPKQEKILGLATLSGFEFKTSEDPFYNIRARRDGSSLFTMDDGKYVRLHVDGELMMSDTKMEKISNMEFIRKAKGRVFIAGLGIGLILHNLRSKIESKEVTEIVVMEKYKDVIDLVSPYYTDLPVTYIHANVLDYKTKKEDVFDTIYFDIWSDICIDNLQEIGVLHNRWKLRKRTPTSWIGSWMKKELQNQKRRNVY